MLISMAEVLFIPLVAAWLITGLARRYSLANGVIDIPNERSSHHHPTPRGGGVSLVIVVIAAAIILGLLGSLPARLVISIVFGGGLVAAIGWIDDQRGLPILHRFAVHTVAAVWALICLGPPTSYPLAPSLGLFCIVVTLVGIVWMINLYNFMDGIDGLAATEAITTAISAALLLWAGGFTALASTACVIGAASLGFLLWNWSPARIFMGDIGSGFLGYLFAVLALYTTHESMLPLSVWIILLGVFIVDATATLLYRALRGERWTQPHRSHAYQRFVQTGLSHSQVTLAVLMINLILSAIAWMVYQWPVTWLPAVVATVVGLLSLWRRALAKGA